MQSLKDAKATRRHIILLTDGWSSSGQYDDILKQMKAAGITLSTVGAGGGSNPFLEQLARNGGGRFYDAANTRPRSRTSSSRRPSRSRASRSSRRSSSRFSRRSRRSCGASRAGSRRCSATTARRRSRRHRRCSSRRATIRSSPSGSTVSGGPWPGRRTRPGAGPRAGSAGTGSRSSSARWSAGRSRARRAAGSRRGSSTVAGGRTCGSKASRPMARLATSTPPASPWSGRTSSRSPSTSRRWPRACTRRRSSRSRAGPMRCA